jgi:hypothetical protein
MDIFNKYKEEIAEDTKFDQINILEKQLMLPALKHKWVSRLIDHKRQKNHLESKRKDLKEQVLKSLEKNGIPSGIPKASLNLKVESSEPIRKIDEDIEELKLIVEYLEKVEKIMSSITFDLGNATKIMVMETT